MINRFLYNNSNWVNFQQDYTLVVAHAGRSYKGLFANTVSKKTTHFLLFVKCFF